MSETAKSSLRQICNRPYLEIESSEMRCKKNVSLTTDTISSNFVYAEAETGLSLKRQGRVVPSSPRSSAAIRRKTTYSLTRFWRRYRPSCVPMNTPMKVVSKRNLSRPISVNQTMTREGSSSKHRCDELYYKL